MRVPTYWRSTTPNGVATGIALANVSSLPASLPVIIRDETGMEIGDARSYLNMDSNGHDSFVLSDGFPVTRQQTRHDRVRYTGRRSNQRVGTALHTSQQRAHDDSGACQRRCWRRGASRT